MKNGVFEKNGSAGLILRSPADPFAAFLSEGSLAASK